MAVFRARRRRLQPLRFRTAFLISMVIFILISLQSFLFIEKRLEPVIINIASTKVEQLATDAINEAISQRIATATDFRSLVYFQNDGEGNVKAVLFNYNEQTRIVGDATTRISNTLKELEHVPINIPLGQALDSNMLAMIGPDIPISMVPMGSVLVSLRPTIQEAGINMVLIDVYVDISAKMAVVIPFSTKPTIVKTSIPITQAIVVGNVPNYYFKGTGNPDGSVAPFVQPTQPTSPVPTPKK